jgi:MOSC domain-containing protein YiiM
VTGRIISVNVSRRKGVQKLPVPEAALQENHGLVGDVHAGPGDRQVSLLAVESIERQRKLFEQEAAAAAQRGGRAPACPKAGAQLGPGAFAENVTTEGIALAALPIGARLLMGESAVLEISQIGKECHRHCAIYRTMGDCVMPREGVFARVIRGGRIRPGDEVRVDTIRRGDGE